MMLYLSQQDVAVCILLWMGTFKVAWCYIEQLPALLAAPSRFVMALCTVQLLQP
jgi:hypothetical protein